VDQRTKELQKALIELANSNAELAQFAYVASHDLQEPIRKIITYSDRLQNSKQTRSETDQAHLNKIMSSAERMRKLISDVLNISNLSGSLGQHEDVDLNTVLIDVQKDLDLAIEDKKVSVKVDRLPIVKGYPVQLYQLFYNLLSNAIKFSSDHRVPLVLIMFKELTLLDLVVYPDLETRFVYIDITIGDNGIGFLPEFADQIFNIFQRLDHDHGKYPGSGIGLALCRKIVINHKGLIFAEATPNKGATFHILLPAGAA
jgi:two-component system CheB/CheR fusion protein